MNGTAVGANFPVAISFLVLFLKLLRVIAMLYVNGYRIRFVSDSDLSLRQVFECSRNYFVYFVYYRKYL